MEISDKTKKIIIGTLLLLLVLAVVVLSVIVSKKSDKLDVSEQNVKALSDTLTEVRLKNEELLAYKSAYVIDKESLEKYLGVKDAEIEELEDKLKANVLYISKLKAQAKTDTIVMVAKRDCGDQGCCRYTFSDSTQYYVIGGYADVDTLDNGTVTITDNEMSVDLKVGIDDEWKIFATTSNPYVKITSMDGALLDKNVYLKQQKVKHWGFGVQVGFGGQYGIINKKFDVGPYVGIGISYNFVVF